MYAQQYFIADDFYWKKCAEIRLKIFPLYTDTQITDNHSPKLIKDTDFLYFKMVVLVFCHDLTLAIAMVEVDVLFLSHATVSHIKSNGIGCKRFKVLRELNRWIRIELLKLAPNRMRRIYTY